MARIRTVKPEFWTSEQVADCSPITRLLFIGMWNFCDDGGNHPASAKQLKMEIFPSDDITLADVQGMVDELVKNELIVQYTVNNKNYWHVLGWHHQKIDKPNIKHPAYSPNDQQPFDDHSPNDQQPFTPVRESKVMEGKGNVLKKEKSAYEESENPAPPPEPEPAYAKTDTQQPHTDNRMMFEMSLDWKPTANINGVLKFNGLPWNIDTIPNDRFVEFVTHWHGNPDRKTADSWNGLLVGWLKRTQHDKPKTAAGQAQQPKPDQPAKPKYDDPSHRPFKRDEPSPGLSPGKLEELKQKARDMGIVV